MSTFTSAVKGALVDKANEKKASGDYASASVLRLAVDLADGMLKGQEGEALQSAVRDLRAVFLYNAEVVPEDAESWKFSADVLEALKNMGNHFGQRY